MQATSAEATAAATALVRLRAAIGSDQQIRQIFGVGGFLTPLDLAEVFDHAGSVLMPLELRGLLTLFGEWSASEVRLPVHQLMGAVLNAPPPPPPAPPTYVPDEMMLVDAEDETPAAPPASAAPSPPPAAPPSAAGWEVAPSDPSDALSFPEKRQHYVRQNRAAPFATLPVSVSSQFGERTRPAGAAPLAWVDGRTNGEFTGSTVAAAAAVAARAAGKGAAGLGSASTPREAVEQSARAALLFPPNVESPKQSPRRTYHPPFALHHADGPLDSFPQPSPPPTAGGSRRRPPTEAPPAPFATLSDEQLSRLARVDERSKLGPTLWRPQSAPGQAAPAVRPEDAPPAGLLRTFGEAGGGAWPVPKQMTWMDPGAARPFSSRGAGSARPRSSGSFTLGWQ